MNISKITIVGWIALIGIGLLLDYSVQGVVFGDEVGDKAAIIIVPLKPGPEKTYEQSHNELMALHNKILADQKRTNGAGVAAINNALSALFNNENKGNSLITVP